MHERNSLSRDIMMLLGGMAAGIAGSRLLPPLYGAVTGSSRVRTGGDPFRMLMEDHREILSLLDEMLQARPDQLAHRTKLFLLFKRKLAKHALAEEDVIYPIVSKGSADSGQRTHLYDEHAEMKILLHTLEAQLKAGEDWTNVVRSLSGLIRPHIEEEETEIFPQLRHKLNEQSLAQVAGQISREEALVL